MPRMTDEEAEALERLLMQIGKLTRNAIQAQLCRSAPHHF